MKLFEECRKQEEEEVKGKAGRFARKGKQEGQGGKVVAGGGCWVRATDADVPLSMLYIRRKFTISKMLQFFIELWFFCEKSVYCVRCCTLFARESEIQWGNVTCQM